MLKCSRENGFIIYLLFYQTLGAGFGALFHGVLYEGNLFIDSGLIYLTTHFWLQSIASLLTGGLGWGPYLPQGIRWSFPPH